MLSHKDILGCKEGGGQNKANGSWAEFCETFPYKYNFDFYLFYFLPVLLGSIGKYPESLSSLNPLLAFMNYHITFSLNDLNTFEIFKKCIDKCKYLNRKFILFKLNETDPKNDVDIQFWKKINKPK